MPGAPGRPSVPGWPGVPSWPGLPSLPGAPCHARTLTNRSSAAFSGANGAKSQTLRAAGVGPCVISAGGIQCYPCRSRARMPSPVRCLRATSLRRLFVIAPTVCRAMRGSLHASENRLRDDQPRNVKMLSLLGLWTVTVWAFGCLAARVFVGQAGSWYLRPCQAIMPGREGSTGNAGPDGLPGVPGKRGPPGAHGKDGENGAPVRSAALPPRVLS